MKDGWRKSGRRDKGAERGVLVSTCHQQDSRSGWIRYFLSCRDLHPYNMPVYPGALRMDGDTTAIADFASIGHVFRRDNGVRLNVAGPFFPRWFKESLHPSTIIQVPKG